MRRREKVFSALAIIFSIPGQLGIILVSIFDIYHHKHVHYAMLGLFVIGIGISTIFTISEFVYLDKAYPETKRLQVSYILKSIWLVVAIILVVGFGIFDVKKKTFVSSVFEWILGFWYGLYSIILAFDLFPAFKRGSRGSQLEDSIDNFVNNTGFGFGAQQDLETSSGLIDRPSDYSVSGYSRNTLYDLENEQSLLNKEAEGRTIPSSFSPPVLPELPLAGQYIMGRNFGRYIIWA